MRLCELAALEAARQEHGYRAFYLFDSSGDGNAFGVFTVDELLTDDDAGFPTPEAAYQALDRLVAAGNHWLPGPVIDGAGRYVPRLLMGGPDAAPCGRSCCQPTQISVDQVISAQQPDAGVQVAGGSPPAVPIPTTGPLKAPPGVLRALNMRVATYQDIAARVETEARQARLAADREEGEDGAAEPRRRRTAPRADPDEVDYDEGGGEVV